METQESTLIYIAGIIYAIIALIIIIIAKFCGHEISLWTLLYSIITIGFGLCLLYSYGINIYLKSIIDTFIAFLFMTATKIWTYVSPSYEKFNFETLYPLNSELTNENDIIAMVSLYERPPPDSTNILKVFFLNTFSSKINVILNHLNKRFPNIVERSEQIMDIIDIESFKEFSKVEFFRFMGEIKTNALNVFSPRAHIVKYISNIIGTTFRKTFYTNIYWEILFDPFSSFRRVIIPILLVVIVGYIYWPHFSEKIKAFMQFFNLSHLDFIVEDSPVRILNYVMAAIGMFYLFRFLIYFKYHYVDEVRLNTKMYKNIATLQECSYSFRNGIEIITILATISFFAFKSFDILQSYDLNLNLLYTCSSICLIIIAFVVLTLLWVYKKLIIDRLFSKADFFERVSEYKNVKGIEPTIKYSGVTYNRDWFEGNKTKILYYTHGKENQTITKYMTYDHVKRNFKKLKFDNDVLKQEAFYIKKHILCDTENIQIDIEELKKHKYYLFFSNLQTFIGKRKYICIYPLVTALLISYICLIVYEQLFPLEASPVKYDEREMFIQLFYITIIGCFIIFYILDAFDIFSYTIFMKFDVGDLIFILNAVAFFIIFIIGLSRR